MISLGLSGLAGDSRILLGGMLESLAGRCEKGRPAVIVTDENVRRLYAKSFPPWPVVTIPAGEANKTLRTVSGIYREFLKLNIDRHWLVAGVGGGIVCDVAGFASSTYLRGLEFGFAATTLLAQVDAALGGKNGVDFLGYKNLVGTFNQPRFVICDFETLKTLPEKEIRCGLAEIIKSAAIADAELFSFLETDIGSCIGLDRRAVEYAVERSCRVKIGIVGVDEREGGERKKLNFGHTYGHALEKISRPSHGEAVSAGMAVAARLSVKRGLLSRDDENRLTDLLAAAGLPLAMKVSRARLREALLKDKKRKGGRIQFVLLGRLGGAVIEDVDSEEVVEAAGEVSDDLR